jgi:argininosuccinate lyase
VHLNIEKRLTALVGDAGKRLHTGRSRNDQVATDIRLWLREEIDGLEALLKAYQGALLDLAEARRHADARLHAPAGGAAGHLRPPPAGLFRDGGARPRNASPTAARRVNRLPLGAAALAGTSYPIDREFVARELGFDGVCANSLDAVSDRDFAIEFAAAARW